MALEVVVSLRRQPAVHRARAAAGLAVSCLACLAPAGPLRVAAFRCDVTPPPGEPLLWATPLVSVETPLLAKGVVLEDGPDSCVIMWSKAKLSARSTLPTRLPGSSISLL